MVAPQLDATQLAVLKQLAHTAASVPSVPQSLPVADPVNFQKFPSSSGVNGSSSYLSEPPRSMAQNEQRYIGYGSPEHESRTNSHFDERDTMRGRYRGGGFRSRGRGDRLGRNWDTRDRYRDSERDTRSPPRSHRRGWDRSRSPPRNGDKRSSRYVSPLRKPTEALPSDIWPRDFSMGTKNESGKDEFGRDIRSESPKSPVHPSNALSNSQSPPPPTVDPRKPPNLDVSDSSRTENPVTPISSNTYSSMASATPDAKSTELGLDSFHPATFDYLSAVSWEVLGKMWQVTHGTLPSQEQLMQFVLSYGTGQLMDSSFQSSNQTVYEQNYAPTSRGRGRGAFRGRGGYGNGRGVQDTWAYDEGSHSTDAIVLGGGDSGDSHTDNNGDQSPSIPTQQNHSSTPGAGRMQKLGGKWLYVRDVTADVP